MLLTCDDSVVYASVVSRSVDVCPVHSYKRSGRSSERQRTRGVLVSDGGAERDETVRVHLSYKEVNGLISE